MNTLKASLKPTVRFAAMHDAERIARLSAQLGYSSTIEETARRLQELNGRSEHAVYVAEVDGMLVGWVHVFVCHSLLADTPAEVAGLVVDERHRGRGIGQALMQRAEQWAQQQGCSSVRLRSNVLRSDAHSFYVRLGYEVIKSQKAFRKWLRS